MESEWQELRLGDVVEFVADNRGKNPKAYAETGIPVIDNYLITSDWRININDVRRFIDEDTYNSFIRKHIKEDDVLVTLVGNGYGQVGITPSCRCVIIQNTIGLRCNEEHDNKYLYYLLKLNRPSLMNLNIGAAQPSIKVGNLLDLIFPFPPLGEQKAIAQILAALDDKIELNRQINSTLESMAQALFKSWFMDFDPVIDNALAAGNPIPDALQARARARQEMRSGASTSAQPLPAEIQRLFPSSFVFSEEMGWVPEAWEVVSLRSLTSKIGSGSTPRGGSQVYVKDGVSLIRSQNVYDSEFTWDGLAHINNEAAKQLKGVTLEEGDVLLNITGASILRTCIVTPDALPARVNQHVAIVRPITGVPSKYLHLHLLNGKTKSYLMGQNAGASREAVTKGHIESVPTLNPGEQILFQFEKNVSPFTKSIFGRNSNVMTLTALRDSLLPKLLSGQLQVPEAEHQLAEVI
ncbi:restriction endonuclease subunit S [Microbulbifer bruguierae]|uniref:Restriction endonuclease subunit S n=1 Tax=Microbulbifer bruguierae TaxID=3029061 RepID=A0ABY8N8I6_9GAMM|nr:restriction endonuclease subunit S [Microbulbifer bruguierae]WGL15210.1 restriction endonuclease subunit S [Microbulbifer bruguierae]